ncbi:Abi-alpha family protein [Nocardia australiensis]|uniref:Abi-alpha family protein n=1 Tax=Nocardia australiensis TaxID=2887191 RepID=UPI001D13A28C|nr:Abi-alpha family protein [Nocardia australiensis]
MVVTEPDGDDQQASGPPESVRPQPSTASTEITRRSVTEIELTAETPTRTRKPGSARKTVRAATGIARVAVTAVSDVAAWSIDTALGVGATVVRGSAAGTPPREVLAAAEAEVREAIRRALRIPTVPEPPDPAALPTLREQGAALLRLSASTHGEPQETHPAFARMLADLTPDEARVLRFLHLDGPQPSIDIRTGRPRGLGAERVMSGLNLIGEHAGLRFPNRIQQYLPNLRRLGLIEFVKEPVGNPNRYQLLEAQSPVREVLKRSGFGTKVHYRSIALTGFGADFVQTCLPVVIQDGRASGTS